MRVSRLRVCAVAIVALLAAAGVARGQQCTFPQSVAWTAANAADVTLTGELNASATVIIGTWALRDPTEPDGRFTLTRRARHPVG
jgi:hypothetical protein